MDELKESMIKTYEDQADKTLTELAEHIQAQGEARCEDD